KNFLEDCVKALSTDHEAVIAFGTTHWIDAAGKPHAKSSGWSDTRDLSLIGRYFTVFWGNMNPIIALIRTSKIKQQKFEDMVGIDLAILLSLASQGNFIHVWSTHWYRREFRQEANYKKKLERYRNADYALSTSWIGRHLPLSRLPLRILRDVFTAKISLRFKLMIFLLLIPSLPIKYLVDKAKNN